MSDVTVILNFYNKPVDMLDMQMKALQYQSVVPKYVWGCFLGCKDNTLLEAFLKWKDKFENLDYISSSYNFKYIGRYQLALTAPTEYVIVLDDDRFPNEDFVKCTRDVLVKKDCLIGQYGWILDDVKMDVNGLFVFPNWMIKKKNPGTSYYFNRMELYSKNIGEHWNNSTKKDISQNYIENKLVYEKKGNAIDEFSLLHIDYICGGISFRKSTLYKLFQGEIPTIETGEDIIFCLRAKNYGIPVYCLGPTYKQFLFADDRNISSTSSLSVLHKRTKLIRDIMK